VNGLSLKTLLIKTSSSRSYIYKLISQDSFPRPIKVGRRSIWVEAEVEAWLADQVAKRDSAVRAKAAV
jgi:prophage regulatory protein